MLLNVLLSHLAKPCILILHKPATPTMMAVMMMLMKKMKVVNMMFEQLSSNVAATSLRLMKVMVTVNGGLKILKSQWTWGSSKMRSQTTEASFILLAVCFCRRKLGHGRPLLVTCAKKWWSTPSQQSKSCSAMWSAWQTVGEGSAKLSPL
ncbi:hypothetical protein V5799_025642 [Amblyomma americanum]|uniref:Uncharacterized protein n=1 Tax=Amblyomma americanum TaxID=6943 RepID=A0AAQ4E8R8_AMBAM